MDLDDINLSFDPFPHDDTLSNIATPPACHSWDQPATRYYDTYNGNADNLTFSDYRDIDVLTNQYESNADLYVDPNDWEKYLMPSDVHVDPNEWEKYLVPSKPERLIARQAGTSPCTDEGYYSKTPSIENPLDKLPPVVSDEENHDAIEKNLDKLTCDRLQKPKNTKTLPRTIKKKVEKGRRDTCRQPRTPSWDIPQLQNQPEQRPTANSSVPARPIRLVGKVKPRKRGRGRPRNVERTDGADRTQGCRDKYKMLDTAALKYGVSVVEQALNSGFNPPEDFRLAVQSFQEQQTWSLNVEVVFSDFLPTVPQANRRGPKPKKPPTMDEMHSDAQKKSGVKYYLLLACLESLKSSSKYLQYCDQLLASIRNEGDTEFSIELEKDLPA